MYTLQRSNLFFGRNFPFTSICWLETWWKYHRKYADLKWLKNLFQTWAFLVLWSPSLLTWLWRKPFKSTSSALRACLFIFLFIFGSLYWHSPSWGDSPQEIVLNKLNKFFRLFFFLILICCLENILNLLSQFGKQEHFYILKGSDLQVQLPPPPRNNGHYIFLGGTTPLVFTKWDFEFITQLMYDWGVCFFKTSIYLKPVLIWLEFVVGAIIN